MKKEGAVTNLRVVKSGATSLIRGSSSFFAVPYDVSGGAIAVVPLGYKGKMKDLLSSSKRILNQLHSFDFNPFDDRVLATGYVIIWPKSALCFVNQEINTSARDNLIKLWKVPEEGLTADLKDATSTLQGHEKRITSLDHHPLVNNGKKKKSFFKIAS